MDLIKYSWGIRLSQKARKSSSLVHKNLKKLDKGSADSKDLSLTVTFVESRGWSREQFSLYVFSAKPLLDFRLSWQGLLWMGVEDTTSTGERG